MQWRLTGPIGVSALADAMEKELKSSEDCIEGEVEFLLCELALELFGPEGLVYGSFADSNFRLSMTAGVAVGASEVQLNLIANRFLGLPRE